MLLRSCSNNVNEVFNSKRDISYRTDTENIGRGRANRKGQSSFYVETSEITNSNYIKAGSQDITTGYWKVRNGFDLVAIVYKDTYLQDNKLGLDLHNEYLTFLQDNPLFDILNEDTPEEKSSSRCQRNDYESSYMA